MMTLTFRLTLLPPLVQKLFSCVCILLFISSPLQAREDSKVYGVATERWYVQQPTDTESPQEHDKPVWDYSLYLDLGYNLNFNFPDNKLWRSRATTFRVNHPQVNLAMGYINKEATPQSRWGIEFGLQAGVDTQNLVPEPPPASNEPIKNADSIRHIYRANGTYLFPVGKGLEVTGGLLNSFIGYESYLAIQNINYTRGYILDYVPYFLFGFQGTYPINNSLDLTLNISDGWNYLAHPNDFPNLGLQAAWQLSPQIRFIQNFYYGPDQEETNLEFWRFFSDSILEWKKEPFLLAGAIDFGTEKQAEMIGHPRFNWMSGALWFGWHIGGPWNLGLRGEFYSDPDGIGTGSKQRIHAYTGTMQYTFSPIASNTIVLSAEYRYDHSTGQQGGFYNGENNELVSDQHQVIFSIMWTFGP
jgi:hypothetical protein